MADQLDLSADHWLGHLKESFEHQAEWRHMKAGEYPDDAERNRDAAAVFEKLAATIKDVTAETGALYAHACNDESRLYTVGEIERELMASIHISYDSAEEFVREVVETALRKDPDEDTKH